VPSCQTRGGVTVANAKTSAEELRQLSPEELANKLRESKEELFNLRFQAATGQLESHGRLGAVRKEIARIYTVIRERELGIGGAA
jgi:large subunit ribosomal protein L29